MKKNFVFKYLLYAVIVVLVSQTCSIAFAHSASQSGILASTYLNVGPYGGYYVGGYDVGWIIDEDCHTNGTSLTYSIATHTDPYVNDYLDAIRDGADMWSDIIEISENHYQNGAGQISTANGNIDDAYASFRGVGDSNGHLDIAANSWTITINRAHSQNISAKILAHEFGHAIGLVDLYSVNCKNKIMYGNPLLGTVSQPSVHDKWGARVIIGTHKTADHTWGYKYHSTLSSGATRHIKYCTSCKGLTNTIALCTYRNNVCTVCGNRQGSTTNSLSERHHHSAAFARAHLFVR